MFTVRNQKRFISPPILSTYCQSIQNLYIAKIVAIVIGGGHNYPLPPLLVRISNVQLILSVPFLTHLKQYPYNQCNAMIPVCYLVACSPTILEINLVGLKLPIVLFAVITVPIFILVRYLFWTHWILKSTPASSNIPSCEFASFPGSHPGQFFFCLCSCLHLESILFFSWLIT